MNLKIVSDSSSDLLDNDDIKIVPLVLRNDQHEFVDDSSINVDEMLKTFSEDGLRTTSSCPSVGTYEAAYEGNENVIAVAISSLMSGSYNAARVAAESFEGKNIEVIDSLSAGPGLHIIIDKILELKDQYDSFDELVEKVRDYMSHTRLVFVLESLETFVNNGRISPIVAKAVSMFGIRVISRANEGAFDIITKKKGAKKAMAAVLEEMISQGYEGGKVIIHHVNNSAIVQSLKDKIHELYPDAVVTDFPCKGLCAYYAMDQGYLLSYEVK